MTWVCPHPHWPLGKKIVIESPLPYNFVHNITSLQVVFRSSITLSTKVLFTPHTPHNHDWFILCVHLPEQTLRRTSRPRYRLRVIDQLNLNPTSINTEQSMIVGMIHTDVIASSLHPDESRSIYTTRSADSPLGYHWQRWHHTTKRWISFDRKRRLVHVYTSICMCNPITTWKLFPSVCVWWTCWKWWCIYTVRCHRRVETVDALFTGSTRTERPRAGAADGPRDAAHQCTVESFG